MNKKTLNLIIILTVVIPFIITASLILNSSIRTVNKVSLAVTITSRSKYGSYLLLNYQVHNPTNYTIFDCTLLTKTLSSNGTEIAILSNLNVNTLQPLQSSDILEILVSPSYYNLTAYGYKQPIH